MDCQNDCCHACWRATSADAEPTGQVVVYWASKSPLRCTNAVAPGGTRLIAPPSASSAIPPDAPGAPATRWKFCTPASRVPMPGLLSGVVKVNEVATPKLPPPPPRQAQNRSELVFALAVRIWPSAVTICMDVTLSQVRP